MSDLPSKEDVIGQPLVQISHSSYSEPEFILQGIGPATFRSHFLSFANGLVLDLFTADLTVASLPEPSMPGETVGISPNEFLGRRVASVVLDDTSAVLIILDGNIFLKDANDGCYGNPLLAGQVSKHYSEAEIATFVDFWSGQPFSPVPEDA